MGAGVGVGGVGFRGVIGGAAEAVVVSGGGSVVVLAAGAPFQEGEGEVVQRLRLDRSMSRCGCH